MKSGITLLLALALTTAVVPPAAAQADRQAKAGAGSAQATQRLSLDDAVRLAMENNPDIAVDRLEPVAAAGRVAQASAAFLPSVAGNFARGHQVQPPSNLLVNAGGTVTDTFNSTLGVGQRLPWAGTSYNVSWNASRQTTNSFFQNFSPSLGSIVQVSFSQ